MSRRLSLVLKDPKIKTKPKVKFPDELIFLDNIKENNIKEIKTMLRRTSANLDINKINDTGLTVLHQAVLNNSIEVVKVLIENHADVNAVDEENWTPLHAAAFMNYHDICEYLLMKASNPTALTLDDERPIDLVEPTNLALISLFLNQMKTNEQISEQETDETQSDLIDYKRISDIFKQNDNEQTIINNIKDITQDDLLETKEFILSLTTALFDSCKSDEASFDLDRFNTNCSVLNTFLSLSRDNQIYCSNTILTTIINLNLPLTLVQNLLVIIKDNNIISKNTYSAWKESVNQDNNAIIEHLNNLNFF